MARDEAVHRNRPLLPDAVRTVLGLRVDCRVPVGVVKHDGVRGGESDPEPPRARRDQVHEVVALGVLEAGNLVAPPRDRCRSVQPKILVSPVLHEVAEDVEHRRELREDEHLPALALQLAEQLIQHQHLPGRAHDRLVRPPGVDVGLFKQEGVVAHLAELHDERVEALVGIRLPRAREVRALPREHPRVPERLHVRERHEDLGLGLRGDHHR
mmetsp:Transcript_5485/g.13327  ORF Transcript_5485/g.13327 Transcript_5485/m.13327 type:complete len:212 (+) Transcript_5485:1449-2084(+)